MSGAGKSTLASALAEKLAALHLPAEILDGDVVRGYLSQELGYSRADRDVNVRRIAYVAGLLARHGVFVITAVISPYADARAEARRLSPRFVEIYVSASIDALRARDPKGLYARADAGEIPQFTGVCDPYEPPQNPDITVQTDSQTVEESVDIILNALRDRALLPQKALQEPVYGG
ncbi:MAG: adenylyl-sulfate kinase [Vampirovibrionales bacterium]|nr:adenylyl-sulfate kinase [Vampirovibrionales bacterium]